MGINPPKLGNPGKVLEVTLGCKPDEIAESVVVTPFIPLKSFARHLDPEGRQELNPRFFFKGVTGKRNGVPVTVILTGVGPSRVGDLVSLLALTNAKRVIFAGAVGALHLDWQIGDFFLPTEAADGEGYTRYVLSPFEEIIAAARRVPCSTGPTSRLAAFLRENGHVTREGKVFTIGSIAFEAEENLKALADAGFDALEMELSAFYSACAHHGLDAAALTYVSDLPLKSSLWQEKNPREQEALGKAWRLLPEICLGAATAL